MSARSLATLAESAGSNGTTACAAAPRTDVGAAAAVGGGSASRTIATAPYGRVIPASRTRRQTTRFFVSLSVSSIRISSRELRTNVARRVEVQPQSPLIPHALTLVAGAPA